MKRILRTAVTVVAVAAGLAANAQPVIVPPTHSSEYQKMKSQGKINGPLLIINRDTMAMPVQPKIHSGSSTQTSVLCNCMIPVDSTFQVVPFDFYTPPEYRNDDGSTAQINIPFNFCFYGQTMNSCFINNNGNISFGTAYGTFTANAFPDPNFIMIAPFWADVDTRNTASGLVYYKITSTYMIVRWQTVGYYSMHADKLNDFQLIITDGSDPILPAGNNVNFCYGDMQWTTGDASSGVGGFGGSPATVGVNRGNGIDFIQIGQFDAPGTAYDGPFGNVDQVSWLDNQTFYFDVCNNGSGNNLPPILNSAQVCDTVTLCIGDTTSIAATFLSPEQGQITNATMTGNGLNVVSNTSGNPAVIVGVFTASASNTGYNSITITGTDNGTPAATTTASVVINVIASPAINFTMSPTPPQPAGTTVTFTDNTPGATSWLWDFGDGNTSTLQNPTHTYANDSLYTVSLTVTVGSCSATMTQMYLIQTDIPVPPVSAPNVVTPGTDGKNDVLEFTNLLEHPNSKLVVYNRWGNKVYESSDYHNDWKPNVSDGVYYYVLSGPNLEKPFTGFFHVINEK
jgi:gliding motility-associated-like protein